MHHVVDDLKRVQRFGRWATDTFHIYLWESHKPMRPVARGMAEDRSELTQPLAATMRSTTEAGLNEAAGPAWGAGRPASGPCGRQPAPQKAVPCRTASRLRPGEGRRSPAHRHAGERRQGSAKKRKSPGIN